MTRPCCKRSRCETTVRCTNGEMENGYCSQHVSDYLFPIFAAKEQRPIKGQKETSRTYCKHSRHLSVCGQYRNAPVPKVPRQRRYEGVRVGDRRRPHGTLYMYFVGKCHKGECYKSYRNGMFV